jgi:adenosylcobinamide-phosphate synthase
MIFYSLRETIWLLLAAIALDLLIGDPRWLPHPVVLIGRWIGFAEKRLRRGGIRPQALRIRGIALTLSTVLPAFGIMWLLAKAADFIHPWLGYAVTVWFISSTIAVKGLKDAAFQVYVPLKEHRLAEARKYTGYIVGRDTQELDEDQLTRAVVETVAENIVDAVVSPLFYALLGAAPLAMFYRAANTLDSMVGYKNEKYLHFGWASARWDDVLNWLPARLTGFLIVIVALLHPGLSAARAAKAVFRFAHLHPSPNSGIPESAVAGALGIELGGLNTYGGIVSDRARMGWPLRERRKEDIPAAVRICYAVSILWAGGLLCALWLRP